MPRSAEERVLARLREALPSPPYRLYSNVRWIVRDGLGRVRGVSMR
jgi:hypothetical protein